MSFYSRNSWWLIDLLNKNRLTGKIFVFLKKYIKKGDFRIDSLPEVKPEEEASSRPRYTIILPSVRKSKVFGGVNTALKFFQGLLDKEDADGRIIVMSSERYSKDLTIAIDSFTQDNHGRSLVFLSETDAIGIRKNERFIFTTWSSAYVFMPLFQWQLKNYQLTDKKAIYFIQDFEPGFAAWSSWYALADSTYRLHASDIIAVFNSEELYGYFKYHHYTFGYEAYFRPTLNDALKKILEDNLNSGKPFPRKKQILIYGRPNEPRNAYEIVRYTLAKWSREYSRAKEWSIVSLGAPGDDVRLKNNRIIHKGKVTLEEYAEYMTQSYAGISLMISPHPSYPPLEMSTFGVKTITNNFANKDLAGFNDNIFSVGECIPDRICELLITICEGYDGAFSSPSVNEEYVRGKHFESVIKEIADYVSHL